MNRQNVYRSLLELYFSQHDNTQIVYHQIASFNHFMNVEVPQTILRSCPIRVTGSPDLNLTGTTRAAAGTAGTAIRVSVDSADDGPATISTTKPGGPMLHAASPEEPHREVEVCVEFTNVQVRKPTIFENNGAVTPMYPNDARLRNLTYAAPVYTDIIATYTMRSPPTEVGGEPTVQTCRRTLPHVQVGRIPVMVGSDYCLLKDLPEKRPHELGECAEDIGGYFIIQGGERVIISQERMSENIPFVFRNNKVKNKETEVIEIKSIGPDNEGAPKSFAVKVIQPSKAMISPERIIVTCPRIKAEVPLFIMMRALGIISDREIVELICGSTGGPYDMIMTECIEDAANAGVFTQEQAHEWISNNLGGGGGSRESFSANTLKTTRAPRLTTVQDVLAEECLPHIGGQSMLFEKAAFIAYMTRKVLDVMTGRVPHDDRDAYPNKKVELPGNLIGNLFRYLFSTKVVKDMKTTLTKEIHNGFWKSSGKIEDIINQSNLYKILKSTIVTIGMKSAMATGNFVTGKMGTKAGISQVMNRLTYLSGISHLRRLSTPIEKTGKLLAPRKLHNTQWGFVCPAETPEGHAVGVVKNLSSTALVTLPISPAPAVEFLYDVLHMRNLEDVTRASLGSSVRVFVNGAWIGVLEVDAAGAVAAAEAIRRAKRSGRIHPHTGITYKSARCEIWINTEGGRLIRPVINARAARELVTNPAAIPHWLSVGPTKEDSWEDVLRWRSPAGEGLIEYIDPTETENFFIAMSAEELKPDSTHMEIHPSTILGTMASNIPFPDHNQAPRNAYQSAMGKQAMGLYALNYRERMDTMANLLWYSSVPLVSPFMSRYYRAQSMPSGFNIVVAIMPYGGYNQEDSVMINRASLDRGLFRSEFYRTYKDEEKKNQASGEEERFCIPDPRTTRHMKLANYSKLGPDGIAPENTFVDQDDVLIGKVAPIRLRGVDGAAIAGINHATLQAMSSVAAARAVEAAGGKRYRDSSKLMRTNESGYVDRIYRGRNGEGYAFVKIRVREERRPQIGDKFASRHGQKGTCGLILEPEDMPQTASGIVPDIIINPHCFVGETQVALPNGLSRRIDSFSEEGMEKVMSWDPATKHIYESFSLGRSDRGVQPTIRLTLEDGRTIRCTADHQFKVLDAEGEPVWKEAGALAFGDSIIMGMRGTEDVRCPKEAGWSLRVGEYEIETTTAAGREKALAFARVLGYILTDGCISHSRKTYCAVLYMGSMLDANSIMDDIIILTGKTPKINDVISPNNGSKVYTIYLPNDFARSLAALPGISVGRRTTQPASYPEFLMEESCPTSIIREFLGGSFGGDGWAPYINRNRFSNVGFSQAICSEYMDTMQDRMEQFVDLMDRVGVEAHVRRTRICHMNTETYQTHPRVSVELFVASNAEFYTKIGFRHCVDKQLRLEAAAAYEGYCAEVRRQHDAAMKIVNESMQFIKSVPLALDKVKAMYETEKPLNTYYSLLTPTLIANRRKANRSYELRAFDYKYMESARAWIEAHGCSRWFSKTNYIVSRDAMNLPTYTLGLLRSEPAEPAPVYDIGVSQTHLFVANGSVVKNCIPSRMTIAHVMETILGRLGCETGCLGDATPFNKDMTVEAITTELLRRGLEPHSDEVLYCGYTGRQMPTSIFMGPIFYQRLKHMTADKLHSRATGPLVMLTRQPAEGRARDGGLRFGEMERDVMIAHGASTFLKERMMEASDNFEVHVCKGCGLIGITNKAQNVWNCTGCGNTTDFSQVRIPYAYKLFLQELESMNISSRLLTEGRLHTLAEDSLPHN